MYITHPLIKPNTIEARIYQQVIVASALKKNTLCVLGTGLGKTAIAALTIAGILSKKDGKVLIIAPSRPLVEQHYNSMRNFLNIDEDKIIVLTGKTPPNKREELWKEGKIFIATPQIVENDLIAGRLNVDDFVLLIADEAHHTTGNHSYTFVANKFKGKVHVLGLTASPGSDMDRILEVCENLGIEHVEIRTEDDEDVKPYIAKVRIIPKRVPLPKEFEESLKLIKDALKERLKVLKESGVINSINLTKTELIELQKEIFALDGDEKYELLRIASEALKLFHALEVLETQGRGVFLNYIERLSNQRTKSAKSIVNDERIIKVVNNLRQLDIEHPKFDKLVEIVEEILKKNRDEKIIVFAQYRDTVDKIVRLLNERGIKAIRFVGQSNREGKGMSQKEQIKALEEFKKNGNVLVSTSVSEEGIDISAVNYVIFYEPVPSEIRFIQRRGRAARGEGGIVIILIAKGTVDEIYYRSAIAKEKNMKRILKNMQKILNKKLKERKETLEETREEQLKEKIEENIQTKEVNETKEVKKEENETEKDTKKSIYPDILELLKIKAKETKEKTLLEKVDDEKEKEIEKIKVEGAKKIKIIVDVRERHVGRLLADKAKVEFKVLEVGDYIISDRVAVERKTAEDFVNSIIDKRLFMQLKDLRKYQKPILIVEGKNFFRLHENAIKGAILSIILDFGIPIIFTENIEETVDILIKLAEKEQIKEKRGVYVRYGKTAMSLKEQQRFIVESLPDVGPQLAENLLKHFKTVERVFTAKEDELMEVEGIGEKTAKKIREVLTKEYEG
ncbi:DEAD/DEAH box helicase [Methanotorris igneus]|uniref:Helicase domain protein n=1 Tax=Methanotorris igneus (strain DSM 5666 / JCM 11834 / Kol 5) TaxID=880724 RepID=F6BB43_METIK|nr:DEAD/DEAH box helicase [Methanotorris igneus]AEF95928.1 helicase domain protein [Methanotorris igneus Kol 5]